MLAHIHNHIKANQAKCISRWWDVVPGDGPAGKLNKLRKIVESGGRKSCPSFVGNLVEFCPLNLPEVAHLGHASTWEEKSSQQSRCKSHSTTLFDFVSLRLQGLIQHQLKPCYANKNPTDDYFHWTQVWSNWSLSRTNWLTVLLKLEERLNEFKCCVTWGVFVWLERMLPNCRRSWETWGEVAWC